MEEFPMDINVSDAELDAELARLEALQGGGSYAPVAPAPAPAPAPAVTRAPAVDARQPVAPSAHAVSDTESDLASLLGGGPARNVAVRPAQSAPAPASAVDGGAAAYGATDVAALQPPPRPAAVVVPAQTATVTGAATAVVSAHTHAATPARAPVAAPAPSPAHVSAPATAAAPVSAPGPSTAPSSISTPAERPSVAARRSVRGPLLAVPGSPTAALTQEAQAMIGKLCAMLEECKKKGIEAKAAGRIDEAKQWLNAGSGYQSDIALLRGGQSVESVRAGIAARRTQQSRVQGWTELQKAMFDAYKMRSAEASKTAQKLRLPGLPPTEKAALTSRYHLLVSERKKMEEEMKMITALQQHPAKPMPPAWRWDTVAEPVTLTNDDIGYDDLEVGLISVHHAKDAKGAAEKGSMVHVVCHVPALAAPVISPQHKLDDAGSGELNFVTTQSVNRRSKVTSKTFEKRPIIFELVKTSKGFLGLSSSTAIIAKGVIMLDALLSETSVQASVPLYAPEKIPDAAAIAAGTASISSSILSRKGGTGAPKKAADAAAADADEVAAAAIVEGERGAIVVRFRLHVPLRDQAVRVIEKRVLVMDPLPIISSPAAARAVLQSPEAMAPVLPAVVAPGAATAPRPAASLPAPATSPAAVTPAAAAAPAAAPPPAAPGAAATTPAPSAAPSRAAALQAQQAKLREQLGEAEEELPDYLNVMFYTVSLDASEAEIARCTELKRQGKMTVDGTEDGDNLDMRIGMLQTGVATLVAAVQSEQLSLDAYIARLKEAFQRDMLLGRKLRDMKKPVEAKVVVDRMTIMKKEWETAESNRGDLE